MDAISQLRSKLQELTKESAFDGQPFVLTRELNEWLKAPAEDASRLSTTNWKQICSALSSKHGVSLFTMHYLKLGSYMRILCILIEIGYPSAAKVFTKNDITDSSLPLEIDRLQSLAQAFKSDLFPQKAASDFHRTQWRYFPARFDLRESYSWRQGTVVPICSKELIDVGNTAEVYQVAIPEEFMGEELSTSLSWAKVNGEKHQDASCVVLALKTYIGNFIPVGKNEARAYKLIGKDESFLGYLADCETTSQYSSVSRPDASVESASASSTKTFSILLEYGDYDLNEYFAHTTPPVLQQDITSFWRSLARIASAVQKLHNFQGTARGEDGNEHPTTYHGWHGDVKPDNILRVRNKFRLCDLGDTHISDTSSIKRSYRSRHYLTYGAPESKLSAKSQDETIMQAADIWSLGCVLSLAATWMVLGSDGIEQYRNVRIKATGKILQSRTDISPVDTNGDTLPSVGDFFHDGCKVLPAVTKFHKFLREHARRTDAITNKILNLIDREIFVQQDRRMSATGVSRALNELLREGEESATDDEYSDWRDIFGSQDDSGSPFTLSSPSTSSSEDTMHGRRIASPAEIGPEARLVESMIAERKGLIGRPTLGIKRDSRASRTSDSSTDLVEERRKRSSILSVMASIKSRG